MPAIPYIIMGGSQIAGSAINARAQGKAADKQAEAIEKGIALQREMYNQDRADFAPYRGLGAGAVGNLAYLGGINLPAESQAKDPGAPLTKDQTLANLGLPSNMQLPGVRGPQLSQKWDQNMDLLTQKMNEQRAASGGQTSRVSRQGRTIEIPSSLLPKALSQGWAQVQ